MPEFIEQYNVYKFPELVSKLDELFAEAGVITRKIEAFGLLSFNITLALSKPLVVNYGYAGQETALLKVDKQRLLIYGGTYCAYATGDLFEGATEFRFVFPLACSKGNLNQLDANGQTEAMRQKIRLFARRLKNGILLVT
jgi:hypothetical protein